MNEKTDKVGEVILGTGVDLIENARVKDMISRWDDRFILRVFTAAEKRYCASKAFPAQHFAARFAIKEAVAKALGTGIGPHMGWRDIEVERNASSGAPSVRFHGAAKKYTDDRGVLRVFISLSHTKHYSMAQAVAVGALDACAGDVGQSKIRRDDICRR